MEKKVFRAKYYERGNMLTQKLGDSTYFREGHFHSKFVVAILGSNLRDIRNQIPLSGNLLQLGNFSVYSRW